MTPQMLPIKFPELSESPYAGFLRRLGSFILDALITAPWSFAIMYYQGLDRLNYFYTILPSQAIFVFYYVYTVKRWGGTPGKLIAQIRVVRQDGQKAGWREAILRHIVLWGIGIPSIIAYSMALMTVTDAQYESLGFLERTMLIAENLPAWNTPIIWIMNIWIWSEFLVLLFNKRKRALHDMVANTVVIKTKFAGQAERLAEEAEN